MLNPPIIVNINSLQENLKAKLKDSKLGLISSISGQELFTLILNNNEGNASLLISNIENNNTYSALTPAIPQAHWFERYLHEMFGIFPQNHPRLKSVIFNDLGIIDYPPLRSIDQNYQHNFQRDTSFLNIEGNDLYIVPVGPVHAGVIEPGHFRISCVGENIINLEIRLGFVHRGIEKRLTQIPLTSLRFYAESVSSDSSSANALANTLALEQMLELNVSERSKYLRTLAMEIERLSMHICDLGGMATDLGFNTIAMELARLRGQVFAMGDYLTGSRYLRNFIGIGGVRKDDDLYLSKIKSLIINLKPKLTKVINFFINNQNVYQRLHNVGKLSKSLACDFNMVGVAARACNIAYDTRLIYDQGIYPATILKLADESAGDALARTKVRIKEIITSIALIENVLDNIPQGTTQLANVKCLPANCIGLGIVEAFRGELIHLIFSDENGQIKRYAIKDPSFNNWTGLAISARNNLLADFPIINKSFALSYSGHDL